MTFVDDLQRVVSRHRGLLAALLAAAAVLAGLTAVRPGPPPTQVVLAAARDLAGGVSLAADDLARVALPPAAVPDGALAPGAAVLGRLVAGPVRRGEPLTDVRLVGPALLASLSTGDDFDGLVAAPVRIEDAGAVALLHAGDRVDVLAAAATTTAAAGLTAPADAPGAAPADLPVGPDQAAARVVATDVAVVTVPAEADRTGGGALVVLATTPRVAGELAGAVVSAQLSLVIRS